MPRPLRARRPRVPFELQGLARQHDVDDLLSEFALAHVEGSATVVAYARDDPFGNPTGRMLMR